MEPNGFSADLNAYLKKVLADNGREDLSGRWLDEITGGARSYDYWSKIVKDTRAMTTNDIAELARSFGISPFEWVENTRRHAAGEATPQLVPNVGAATDDGAVLTAEEEKQLRKSDYALATNRGKNDADVQHAE